MMSFRVVKRLRYAAVLAVFVLMAAPAAATTLIRMGLDELVASNQTIVLGKVVGTRSYWNEDRSFILTDIRVRAKEVLKGNPGKRNFTVTIMGGKVGDVTTLIVAGPELQIGSEYLLFVNREDLPGASQVATVRDLCQGIFDIVPDPSGTVAISQAARHPLLADKSGFVEPPGGRSGIALHDVLREIRSLSLTGNPSAQID